MVGRSSILHALEIATKFGESTFWWKDLQEGSPIFSLAVAAFKALELNLKSRRIKDCLQQTYYIFCEMNMRTRCFTQWISLPFFR